MRRRLDRQPISSKTTLAPCVVGPEAGHRRRGFLRGPRRGRRGNSGARRRVGKCVGLAPVELAGAIEPPADAQPLVAVSGGPDSVALLLWLAQRRDVVACHFDHGLRPEGPDEASWVAEFCAQLGVPLICGRRDRPLPPGSRQAAARQLRYEFFERALGESGCDLVCLAHTADDVVEGVVLHLLRGSGLAGLRGMPRRRGPYYRPLLDVWRCQVEAYLANRGVRPLRDPSNLDPRFERVRVRTGLLPRLEQDRPGLLRRLHRVASSAAHLQERLEAEAAALLDAGAARRARLRSAPRAVRLEAYRQLYGRLPGLSRRQLLEMDRLALAGDTGASLDLPKGLSFRVERDRVSVGPRLGPPPDPAFSVRWCTGCQEPGTVHLRTAHALAVGYRRPGLRMQPLGAPGSRKLKDLLIDAGVPRHLRGHLPLLFAGDRLAWVPGVAVEAALAVEPGEPGWHVRLEGTGGGRKGPMVPSGSANSRSAVT
jgi:tRNA(Ile)-lysidine synthetase-like protein